MTVTSLAEFPTSLRTGLLIRSPHFRVWEKELIQGNVRRTEFWRYARYDFEVGYPVVDGDFKQQVEAFYNGVRGSMAGFLFQDWTRPNPRGEVLGIGDGFRTQFKTWGDTFGGVTAYVSGISTAVTGDATLGFVTFASPPMSGALVTADVQNEKFRVIFIPNDPIQIENLGGDAYRIAIKLVQVKHLTVPSLTVAFPSIPPPT